MYITKVTHLFFCDFKRVWKQLICIELESIEKSIVNALLMNNIHITPLFDEEHKEKKNIIYN